MTEAVDAYVPDFCETCHTAELFSSPRSIIPSQLTDYLK